TKSNQSLCNKCRGFFISKSLEIGILPVEGSTLKLPLLLMHPASGDQGKDNHKKSDRDGQTCPEHEGGRPSNARMAVRVFPTQNPRYWE
ncbi:MAG: hypothetical protein ACXVB4_08975, partial [Pseudobdellovibrionaceae bacterium]